MSRFTSAIIAAILLLAVAFLINQIMHNKLSRFINTKISLWISQKYTTIPPPKLIRVFIRKRDCKTANINFYDTTQQEVYDFIKSIIQEQKELSIFDKGLKTSCDIREWDETFVGKNLCLSFVGLNPELLHKLILEKYK